MTTDPDTVVALTAALLSGNVSKRSGVFGSGIVSSNSTSGLQSRTFAVLDALAGLCVCDPKSEVIAIGCRSQKNNTELIIASNNGAPPDSTLTHLQSVWQLLGDISERTFFGKESSTDSHVDSPQVHCYDDTAFHKLFIEVYKHSFQVIEKCVAKYPCCGRIQETATRLVLMEKIHCSPWASCTGMGI